MAIRRDPVWIGGLEGPDPNIECQPVAPYRVPSYIKDLDTFLQRDDVDPVVAAALTFAQIPAIHPWRDGNGRTGRLVAHAVLAARLDHDGRAPDVARVLVTSWREAVIVKDLWLANGFLDAWLASYCGALIEAVGKAPPEPSTKRRNAPPSRWRR